jgi:hypothetical protein
VTATPIRGYDQWKTAAPDFDEGPCLCCGKPIDNCICPECPVCSEYGNPECYKEHGLKYSAEQVEGMKAVEDAEWKASQDESCGYLTDVLRDLVNAVPILLNREKYESGDEYDQMELDWADQALKSAQEMVKPRPIPENQKSINVVGEVLNPEVKA